MKEPTVRNVAVSESVFKKAPEIFSDAGKSGLRCFCAPAPEKELSEFVRENKISHVIVGTAKYCGLLYDVLPAGGVIARFGVGYDNIDRVRAAGCGQYCTNTPDCLEGTVAEHALCLILAAARRITGQDRALHAGQWTPLTGSSLSGKTLVIVGCGRIGRRVAIAASCGLAMRVVGVAPRHSGNPKLPDGEVFCRIVRDFSEVAGDADFVSLHLPAKPELARYFNAARFALMKRGVVLINTARGMLIDESAMYDALVSGHIASAALDVFENEPYRPVHPDKDLRNLENVIMTPHIGSNTFETNIAMAKRALRNIAAAEAGDFSAMDRV
ncbi:MAG: NAD(P)-dependent oxidoreductase [Victivallales bacterium]|jgi:lactate dehydrogenase-like 2-hydroxyacid dehydrogenase